MRYSAVFELDIPINEDGSYPLREDGTFGPDGPVWSYVAEDTVSFYSPFVSGAMRLKNGHTFVLQGAGGRMFEVTADGEMVWDYWNPYRGGVREPNGDRGFEAPFFWWLFRSTFIPADHPGLQNIDLSPLEKQPEAFKPPKPPQAAG